VTGLQHVEPNRAAALRRIHFELRRVANWVQLVKFCAVGSTGYVVNLTVYAALLASGLDFVPAAVCSFLAAVANNYTLNRLVTFRDRRGGVVIQGARYLSVSVAALIGNVVLLTLFVWTGVGEFAAQAAAIVLVTPVSFLGNKLWSFGR
jgi:putative flippase GtrA